MKNLAISTHDLSIGYHRRKGIKTLATGINLGLESGKLTCLVGSNGVGKSTLLRTLAILQPLVSGQIFIQGKNINALASSDLAKLLSVVLPGISQMGDLSVRDLVQLGRLPYSNWLGQIGEHDRHIVDQALEQVDALNLAERSLVTLSDGERQKVLIARALAQKTKIVILDEPTAFLDWNNRVTILMTLKHLAYSTGAAYLLSSHDLELASQIADNLWVMDSEGKVISGCTKEIIDSGILQRVFSTPYGRFNPLQILHKDQTK